jgi:hypothetical protein
MTFFSVRWNWLQSCVSKAVKCTPTFPYHLLMTCRDPEHTVEILNVTVSSSAIFTTVYLIFFGGQPKGHEVKFPTYVH